jgi:Fe-S cluster biogenesis protein NfuA
MRPTLQQDGGDVVLVDVSEDGVVKVQLTGACKGCPMSQTTIKNGIEKFLKTEVAGVKEVVQV